jgi:hypothetical protein
MACSKAHIKQTGAAAVQAGGSNTPEAPRHVLQASSVAATEVCNTHQQAQGCIEHTLTEFVIPWQLPSRQMFADVAPIFYKQQGVTHDAADSQLTAPGTIKHPSTTHWEGWCLLSATAPHILIKQPHLGKDTCPPA